MAIRRFIASRPAYSLLFLSLTGLMFYGIFRVTLLPSLATKIPASTAVKSLPEPTTDVLESAAIGEQTVVFAGGCFWGMEAVFEHVTGVSEVVTGYAGGSAETAHYAEVSTGQTGHAEAVQITYDPSQVSYGQLLEVYFSVAHDPTQLNRQGPDVGPQYRSAIFFTTAEQGQVAQAYIHQLNESHSFNQPIVTQLVPLDNFYAAEDYHQDFIQHNPDNLYVVVHDLPKLNQLQAQFPDLYE